MRPIAGLLLSAAIAGSAQADGAAAQRALIERDQQSDAFARQLRQSQDAVRAAPARRPALEARQLEERREADAREDAQRRDAGRPLAADPGLARQLQPYERERAAAERRPQPLSEAQAPAPRGALALPGAARRGVDPVAPDRFPD